MIAQIKPAEAMASKTPSAVAVTSADGRFAIVGLDRVAYDLTISATGYLQAGRSGVAAGSRDLELVVAAGLPLAGHVVDARGEPIASYTLVVQRYIHRDLPSWRDVFRVAADCIALVGGVLLILVGTALVTGVWNDFVSWVRDAFVTSVRCSACSGSFAPPVRFQISHVSIVPASSSPLSARSRAPATLSRIHAHFGAAG